MSSLPRSDGTANNPFELPDEPDGSEDDSLDLPDESTRYDLVILNDDTHSFDYVVALLRDLFGISWDTGYGMTETIDWRGERVVFTGTWDEVTQKRAGIIGYGPDPWTGTQEPLQVEIREAE
jgi:ATP-dependent Clp protease adaptor protein ClpS